MYPFLKHSCLNPLYQLALVKVGSGFSKCLLWVRVIALWLWLLTATILKGAQ